MPGAITEPPPAFRNWLAENAARLEAARRRGTEPYFVRNNAGVIDNILNPNTSSAATSHNIANGVASVRNTKAGRTPEQIANVSEIETAMKIECGEPMSFEDANEMRANPNYRKGVKYRQNCQSSVVANEMRRLGFDVEAYGNDKKEWYMPTLLAKRPEIAFIDADGNPPTPIGINYHGDLMSSLNNQMTAPGRYHLRFCFGNTNNTGHIITAERLADGTLRIYDPQNGKIIKDFSEYTAGVKVDSFEYYRVDNLRFNPDVVRGVVKPRGEKGDAPRMQLPEIQNALEKGWYGDYKPEYAPLTSPELKKRLDEVRSKSDRIKIFKELLESGNFDVETAKDQSIIFVHPGHKTKDEYWPQTKQMGFALSKSGRDVLFLPESDSATNADAIMVVKGYPRVVDFRYSASTRWNTLQQHLAEGFEQADAIVLKLENMDSGQFRNAIEYMKRNNLPLGDVILINQYNNIVELSQRQLRSGRYINKIRGFLK